ncbi:MAG: peptide chain release factor 1 [Clostridia bacterium]|nr:peptide chain release factor 1 [Clostridia bacterium]
MLEKLDKIILRYEEIGNLLMDANVVSDNKKRIELGKERTDLEELYTEALKLKQLEKDYNDVLEMIEIETDEDLKLMAEEERDNLKTQIASCEENLKFMLLPKDENEKRNVILEIRPGTGGDESALFANEVLRMYLKYCERKKFKVEIIDLFETELGGLKEATVSIKGKNVYPTLKFESGVHRVQRVPTTETQGRVHTSAITVAVLPEIEDVDIEINEKDLRIDTYRSSGAGGQHVNKTDSAVRITHLPTNTVVQCQSQRSQTQNKEVAMNMLKSKLYDMEKMQKDKEYAENRKTQVGSGDRSERIRTYNFPQGRLTDHRINLTLYSLLNIMEGDLDPVVIPLQEAEKKAKLGIA